MVTLLSITDAAHDAHRGLWQWRWRLRWRWLAWCFSLAVNASFQLGLGQCCSPHYDPCGNAVTVDARVAPHTSASKPCMRVSPHTAPQLLSPCHGCMPYRPCLGNPLLQQQKKIFFSSLPSCDVALSMRFYLICYLLLSLPSNRLHVGISSGFPRGISFLKNPTL